MWSIACADTIRVRMWSGEDAAVAYNVVSGDTHLIESPGPELLELLAQAPCTKEVLVHAIAERYIDEEGDALVKHVDAALQHLQAVGLINETDV